MYTFLAGLIRKVRDKERASENKYIINVRYYTDGIATDYSESQIRVQKYK